MVHVAEMMKKILRFAMRDIQYPRISHIRGDACFQVPADNFARHRYMQFSTCAGIFRLPMQMDQILIAGLHLSAISSSASRARAERTGSRSRVTHAKRSDKRARVMNAPGYAGGEVRIFQKFVGSLK